jgi:hypothetical protein
MLVSKTLLLGMFFENDKVNAEQERIAWARR